MVQQKFVTGVFRHAESKPADLLRVMKPSQQRGSQHMKAYVKSSDLRYAVLKSSDIGGTEVE